MDFFSKIEPFYWVEHDDCYSVCMLTGEFKEDLFKTKVNENFEATACDWEAIAIAFISRKMPSLVNSISFDSKVGMFCAYSEDEEDLKTFILEFRKMCKNDDLLKELYNMSDIK